MILFNFVWLNFMLIIMTSGYTTLAAFIYCALALLMLFSFFVEQIDINDKNKNSDILHTYQFIDLNSFKVNIFCAAVIHSTLIWFFMGMHWLAIIVAAIALVRIFGITQAEKKL